MIRQCVLCDEEFDTASPAKRMAGGLITHCPECSDEPVVKYAGVSNGAGKMASCEILKFDNVKDREAYIRFWRNNSGMHKGKECQMRGTSTTPGISFTTVQAVVPNANHKGKS